MESEPASQLLEAPPRMAAAGAEPVTGRALVTDDAPVGAAMVARWPAGCVATPVPDRTARPS